MRLKCPHCGAHGMVPAVLSGRVLRCSRCLNYFLIPSAAGQSPVAEYASRTHPNTLPAADDRVLEQEGPEEGTSGADDVEHNKESEPTIVISDDAVADRSGQAHSVGTDQGDQSDRLVSGSEEPDFPDLSAQQVAWERVAAETEPRADAIAVAAPDENRLASTQAADNEHQLQQELHALLAENRSGTEKIDDSVARETDLDTVDQEPTAGQPASRVANILSPADGALPEQSGVGDGRFRAFGVAAIVRESWGLVSGIKGPIWCGVLVLLFLLVGIETGLQFIAPELDRWGGTAAVAWGTLAARMFEMLLTVIIVAGLFNIGVRRARGTSFSWQTALSGATVGGQVVIAWLLATLLILSGLFLFILPGIYLAVGYSLALPLIVARRCGPWDALEASRRIIHRQWWQVFVLYLFLFLLFLLSCIPAGLGLIWSVPLLFAVSGVLYRRLVPTDIPR